MTSSVAFAVSVVDGAMTVVSLAGVLAQSQRFISNLLSNCGGDSPNKQASVTQVIFFFPFLRTPLTTAIHGMEQYGLERLLVFLATDRPFPEVSRLTVVSRSWRTTVRVPCSFTSSAAQSNTMYHYRRAAFSSQLKSTVGHILAKAAALRINLNIDGAPIASRSHTHPSHHSVRRR